MYKEFDHSIYVEVGIENVSAVRLLSSAVVVKLSSCLRVQFEPSERSSIVVPLILYLAYYPSLPTSFPRSYKFQP